MADTQANYVETIQQALISRRDWLEKEALTKLKNELRIFHASYASLYNIYLKKKLIDEDPYKQEAKISELEVPETSGFNEAKKVEQLSIRLSNYDNQLDFLVNFYQLGLDYLNLDRLKRILGLVRYIDWMNLSPDAQTIMTKSVAEMTIASKAGVDPITLSIIGEGLSRLSKTSLNVINILRDLNLYYRESYKLDVRQKAMQGMTASDANLESIKKKIQQTMPGSPVYKELLEEVIKEDFSKNGSDFRNAILSSLKVPIEKAKIEKPPVNFKSILLDGIQVIGGSSNSLTEISAKIDENHAILESHKRGLLHAIKELIRQITNAEPEEVFYNVEYLDMAKGVNVKEKVNFYQFRDMMNKKIKILSSFVRGPAFQKLTAMSEEQIIVHLERNIKEMQTLHRTLGGLDDYFKANSTPSEREKIKGIKPELSALKNSFVKANQLRYEYNAQKEEEDQFKRLGISAGPTDNGPVLPEGSALPT